MNGLVARTGPGTCAVSRSCRREDGRPARHAGHKFGGQRRARLCSRDAMGGEPDVIPRSPPAQGQR